MNYPYKNINIKYLYSLLYNSARVVASQFVWQKKIIAIEYFYIVCLLL